MAKRLMVEDVRKLLSKEVEKAGSQRALARQIGISVQYISRFLAGEVPPGKRVLDWLGIEEAGMTYQWKAPDQKPHRGGGRSEAHGRLLDQHRSPDGGQNHPPRRATEVSLRLRQASHALFGGRRVQHGGGVRVVRVEAPSDAEAERGGEVMQRERDLERRIAELE